MKIFKRTMILGLASVGLLVLGTAPQAQALTFNLNCIIENGGCTQTGGSFGTVTVTNAVAGTVNVTVDTDPTYWASKVQTLALNTTVAGGTFSSTGPVIETNFNAVNVGPYCTPSGCFDLKAPADGTLGFTPQSFKLVWSGGALTETNFLATAGAANLFAAVHIGNINANGDSLFVGATSLPLPPTLLLLGASFVGLGLARRFQK